MLDKLEFMISLSREQHFGRAAESCGVAQPTLSLGIQSLEQMLNTPLVKRASRFPGFTPEGERVRVWAHRLVGDARAMRQDLLGLKSGTDSHLRIAAIPSAMPLVARLTVPLQLRHPNVRFTVLGRTSTVLLNMLRQREIEAGVTYLSNEPIGDVSAIPIYREEYLLLTTADGPFGDTDRVTWSQAAEAPLCLLARDMQSRRIVDSILRRIGIELTPLMETDSLTALMAHVRVGRWASIIPNSALESGAGIPRLGLALPGAALMEASGWLQLVALGLALLVGARVLGAYIARVFSGEPLREDRVFGPVERVIYRAAGVTPESEQRWTAYARSVLAFSVVSVLGSSD